MDTVDNFLEHFGIKGMQWGVRRSRGSDGTVSGALTKTHPNEPDDVVAIKAKASSSGIHSLSNNEMQTLINRMNLQAQISTISSKPSILKRGRAFTDDQLKSGKTLNEILKFANSPAAELITGALGTRSSGRHLAGKRADPGATQKALKGFIKSVKR